MIEITEKLVDEVAKSLYDQSIHTTTLRGVAFPIWIQTTFEVQKPFIDMARTALATAARSLKVSDAMIERGARVMCVDNPFASLENHTPDDEVILSYSVNGDVKGKRWEKCKESVEKILIAACKPLPDLSTYISDRVFEGTRPIPKERVDFLREQYRKKD